MRLPRLRWISIGVSVAAVAAMLGVSAVLGFAVELLGIFRDFNIPLLVITAVLPWALVLTVALTGIARWWGSRTAAVGAGILLGAAGGIVFMLGLFVPYPLGVGGRELREFGTADVGWFNWLWSWLLMGAAGGAIIGVGAGAMARALNSGFGADKPIVREGNR